MIGTIDWADISMGIVIGVVCGWYLRRLFAKS